MNEKDAVLREKSLDRWLDEREVSGSVQNFSHIL